MTADDHGSISTYVNHKCRCVLCVEAWRLYFIDYRAARRQETADNGGVAPVWQHNRSTYYNWACRCDACCDDVRAHRRSPPVTA